jgi:hypothetical protein
MPVLTDRNSAQHLFRIERLNETTFKKREFHNCIVPSGNKPHFSIHHISKNFIFPKKVVINHWNLPAR